MVKPNIKDLSFNDFEAYLLERKQPAYRARQVWQWLYQKRAISFAEMTNVSGAFREQLAADFSISRLAVERRADSADGTAKFLFRLADDRSIESVLIPETNRLTLCISTQVGCAFGCAFCATALLGLKRNLRASEIIDQILEASRISDARPADYQCSVDGHGRTPGELRANGQGPPSDDRQLLGHRHLAATNHPIDRWTGAADTQVDG